MASGGDWCLIESDPGVFSELITQFGVTGAQVEEIWSLDPENFTFMKPVHGLIFLFKWKPHLQHQGSVVRDHRLNKIFFAKQVINNACATQALLSILMNTNHHHINLGPTLSDFKAFSQSFDPATKGLALSNCDVIREVHNSFAKQQVFEQEGALSKKDDDVFHFIGYLPIEGHLYELDGLQEGPIDHGVLKEGVDWIDAVRPVIEERIKKYSSDEIHFSLMSLVSDQKKMCEEKLQQLKETQSPEQVEFYTQKLLAEKKKRHNYKLENTRRRHNYLPFVIECFKILAEKKQLTPLLQQVKEKAEERKRLKMTEGSKGEAPL